MSLVHVSAAVVNFYMCLFFLSSVFFETSAKSDNNVSDIFYALGMSLSLVFLCEY